MSKVFVFLLCRYGKEQKLRDAIRKILFDLLQRRRDIMANVPAQSGDRLFLRKAFNHEEWLNQLRAVELSLRAQVAQVLRTSESLHYKDISFSHRSESEPGADRGPRASSPCGVVVATGSCLIIPTSRSATG